MLPVLPHMQVVTLNSVHSSSPAEDSATTWALPPTLDATNITNTSVLLTAVFPDLATPIQQVVPQQVRVLYAIMEVGGKGVVSSTRPLHLHCCAIAKGMVWSDSTGFVFSGQM